MTTLRRIGLTAAIVTACGLGVAGSAAASSMTETPVPRTSATTSATAQCNPDFTKPGVNIRALPNTGSAIRGQGNPGDCVRVHDAMHGGDVTCDNGVGNNFWYDVSDIRTGVRGWVSACYLPAGTPPGS